MQAVNLDRFSQALARETMPVTESAVIPECDVCGAWLLLTKHKLNGHELCRSCADDMAGIEKETVG